MAFVSLDTQKLSENYRFLDKLFGERNIQWSIVSKVLCGNRDYLNEIVKLGVVQICDSRVSNLKMIKSLNPNIETIYIKPPAKGAIAGVVKYGDISLNTEIETILLLSKEAQKQGKTHKIIIMIEMGELREGVLREELVSFYEKVFDLKNIEVVGIGTNLACLYGVLPNHDKLIQLSLYKQIIEATFRKKIDFVSGGASVTIPLLFHQLLPKGVNHFRVGESLFFGTNVYNDTYIEGMHTDIFRLFAEIIEIEKKHNTPSGEMGTNVSGHSFEFDETVQRGESYRAIVDIGLLDVEEKYIKPLDSDIKIVGASSDMFVLDIGENQKGYKVGDLFEFRMNYLGLLRIMNSKYIEKRILSSEK